LHLQKLVNDELNERKNKSIENKITNQLDLLSFAVKNVFGKYRRTFATNVNAIDRFDNSIL